MRPPALQRRSLQSLPVYERENAEAKLIAAVIDGRKDEWERWEWPELVRAEARTLGVKLTDDDVTAVIRTACD